MRTELAGVFAAGSVRRGSLGHAAISAGEGAAAAKAVHGPGASEAARARIDTDGLGREATEAEWLRSSAFTIPAAFRRRSRASRSPRAWRASTARRSTSSTACSTTPRCSSSSCKHWFGEHMPGYEKRIQPRESWVEDPEMCARSQPDGDAAILGGGSLKHL